VCVCDGGAVGTGKESLRTDSYAISSLEFGRGLPYGLPEQAILMNSAQVHAKGVVMQRMIGILILCTCAFSAVAAEIGLPHEKHPAENLTVSGQPSLEQLQAVKDAGYTTVINLRRDGEFDDFDEAAEVEKLGMDYVHIPVKNVSSITTADASRLNDALENATGPVLLHCTVGWRAGSLWAIEQYLYQGATEEEAVELVSEAHMDHAAGDVEDWIDENGSQ
jgi:uncharacterized protein (TIGR01244 family)